MDDLFSVSGKTILVTGGCGLIGETISQELAKRGADVIIVDVGSSNPAEKADSLPYDKTVGIECDVSKEKSVSRLAGKFYSQFDSLDVLINCHQYKPSGFTEQSPENFSLSLWKKIMNVNLRGTFLTCREFGSRMVDGNGGSIINFASTYGIVSSNPDLYSDNSLGNPVAYSASKGGVLMLTKYLGAHWASDNVNVNALTPHGVFDGHEEEFVSRFNEMSPIGRMMDPEEVIGPVVYLASDASSYSVASNLLVEGGWTSW